MPGGGRRGRGGRPLPSSTGQSSAKRARSGGTNGLANARRRSPPREGSSNATTRTASRSPPPDPRTPPVRSTTRGRATLEPGATQANESVPSQHAAARPNSRSSTLDSLPEDEQHQAPPSTSDPQYEDEEEEEEEEDGEDDEEEDDKVESLESSSASSEELDLTQFEEEADTPENRPRSKTPRSSNPREMSAGALAKAITNVSAVPVHLRIALCHVDRGNAGLKLSDDKGMYLGYTLAPVDAGSEEEQQRVDVGQSDPNGAKVPVYISAEGDKTVLTGGCKDSKLFEAVAGLLPTDLELFPDFSIRVPKVQWTKGSNRNYWSTSSSPRRAGPKNCFMIQSSPYTSDFTEAAARYSVLATMKAHERRRLDAYALDLRVEEAEGAGVPEMDNFPMPYMILEIVVGVRSVAAKPKTKTVVIVEIAAPVQKFPNGEYKVEERDPQNKKLPPLVLQLGDVSDERTRIRYGPIRDEIQQYCFDHVPKYMGKTHRDSRLYFVDNRAGLTCQPIESSDEFYEFLKKAKTTRAPRGAKTVEKSMRLGLTVTENAGQPVWSPQLDDGNLNSQPVTAWYSPTVKPEALNHRFQRAAATVNSRPRELVKELYTHEESPVYHGLTREMCTILMQRFLIPEEVELYKLGDADEGPHLLDKLVSLFQDPKNRERVNHLIPEKGKYPPDESKLAPSYPPPAKEDAATTAVVSHVSGLSSCVASIGDSMKQAVGSRQRTAVMSGISFCRVNKNLETQCSKDVSFLDFNAIQTESGSFKDDPEQRHTFGQRVWAVGRAIANVPFHLTDEQIADLDAKRAQLVFIVDPDFRDNDNKRVGRARMSRDDLFKCNLAAFTKFNTEQKSYDHLPLGILLDYPSQLEGVAQATPNENPIVNLETYDFDSW